MISIVKQEDYFRAGEPRNDPKSRKRGFTASSVVFAYAALENMGFVANMVSLVLYFHLLLHFDLTRSANMLTNLSGSTFLRTVFGGFLSNTYINRFKTLLIFGIVQLLEDSLRAREIFYDPKSRKGGFTASSFVFAYASLENMGFVANLVSFVLYFHLLLHFDLARSANMLTNLVGSTFLLSILSGFLSDTYIDRFKTILIFGVIQILGLLLITIQAHYPSLQPQPCDKSTCVKGGDAVMLYSSLSLLALGTGGVKAIFPALGADQFDEKDPKEAKALATYFNWFMLSTIFGAAIGVTIVVWVSSNKGWWKGFLISLIATFVGFLFVVAGKPFYRLHRPGKNSPILRAVQVIVVAIKNKSLTTPNDPAQLYELHENESLEKSPKIRHTNQFRWLDKATVLPSNKQPSSWTVCTVTQTEEVKIITRMLPIILSTIIMNTCLAQLQTFSVQQGYQMDRYIGSFEIPAPSVAVFPLIIMIFLLPLYEFIFVPFARKMTKHPSGITQLQRVGVGLVLSAISMAVAALVEVKRRNQSLKNPLKPISVFWITIQYCIFGISDMFTFAGLLEFFYVEAPARMKSLSTSFTYLSSSMGYFLSSVLVNIINSVTRRIGHGHQGWLEGGQSLDTYQLNNFYWFLAVLSFLNFLNYLYWASWYTYKQENDDDIAIPKDITANKEEDEASRSTRNVVPIDDDEEPKIEKVGASFP